MGNTIDDAIEIMSKSPAFDPDWYSSNYLDVGLSGIQPSYHYAKYGVAMRRSPSPGIRVDEYEFEFPSALGQNPVVHYENFGRLVGFDLTTGSLPDAAFAGPGATYAAGKSLPRVTVIVPAFNAEATIEPCLRSLLNQTLKDIEIIVLDDVSTDGTAAAVEKVAASDPRVRLVRLAANRGPYWAKNLALYLARAPVVALSDSDDISLPDRLEKQYAALTGDPRRLVCYINYRRVDSTGATVLNRGREHRLGYMTMMARKELFDLIGFFDSVRIAADDEFHSRVKRILDKAQYCHQPLALYQALVRSDSLTALDPVKLDAQAQEESATEPLSFLSETRQNYVHSYREWHERSDDLRLGFPLRHRRFEAPSIAVSAFGESETITASMATFPPRAAKLERVVSRVLPQVDRLRIHLNNFETVPEFLNHEKISITRSQDFGDLRDNGKFIDMADVAEGFHICLDDDILYPRNYVSYLVAKILQYDRRAVVGVHGTILLPDFVRYHDGVSRKTWHFQQELVQDEPVHILGTGTAAYHTSTLAFDLDQVSSTGMIDLWMAKAAQEQGVPMIAVARGQKYLREIAEQRTSSIYDERRLDDSKETEFIKAFDWRILSPFPEPSR